MNKKTEAPINTAIFSFSTLSLAYIDATPIDVVRMSFAPQVSELKGCPKIGCCAC